MVDIVTVAWTLITHLSASLMKNAALLVVDMIRNFVVEIGGYPSLHLRRQCTHKKCIVYVFYCVFVTVICILSGIFYYRAMLVI